MDFDESSTKLVTQEFLAVILAGFGNEQVPFVSGLTLLLNLIPDCFH